MRRRGWPCQLARAALLLALPSPPPCAGAPRQGAAPGCDGGPPFVGDGVEALCAGRFPARDAPEYSRWVVHFYGRGCRRCRAAAEALAGAARLAVSAPSGRAAPLLGAVDCQGSANEALCQEHGAWKLPVVKALGSGARYAGSFEEEELHRWAAEAAGTPVRSASAVPAPLCPAHELYDEPSFAKQFLLAHNVYRCMAGVPLLVWDSRAFATAKRWAEKAPVNRLQHSPDREREAWAVWATVRGERGQRRVARARPGRGPVARRDPQRARRTRRRAEARPGGLGPLHAGSVAEHTPRRLQHCPGPPRGRVPLRPRREREGPQAHAGRGTFGRFCRDRRRAAVWRARRADAGLGHGADRSCSYSSSSCCCSSFSLEVGSRRVEMLI
ncbi:unnamed protein product [Prorocentrum cordatum]|uniref:SCP domain-containing protein n=1 Tax=Prorocentrum cordatum TaxID=2364126 RepID=A0ABN9XV94_9DINO|nr:unnamed protein product [Polarella glacialis]